MTSGPVSSYLGHMFPKWSIHSFLLGLFCSQGKRRWGGHGSQRCAGISCGLVQLGHFVVSSCVLGMLTGQALGMPLPSQINS